MLILSQTHIPALTHDKNKMPAKQRQNQSSVKYRTQGSNTLLYKALSSSLKQYLLVGHFLLLPSLLPDCTVWSDQPRRNAAFETRACLFVLLREHLQEWKIWELWSIYKNISLLVFLACLLYLRTGRGISLVITRLRFNEREMLTFALRPKTWLVLLITVGNLCPV